MMKYKVVIVDDEPGAISSLKMELESLDKGIEVVGTATHMDDAIRQINEQKPDVYCHKRWTMCFLRVTVLYRQDFQWSGEVTSVSLDHEFQCPCYSKKDETSCEQEFGWFLQ